MTSTKEKKKQANNRKFDNLKEKIKNTLKNMKMKKSKKIFLANSKIMRLFVFPNQYVVRQMLNNWICQKNMKQLFSVDWHFFSTLGERLFLLATHSQAHNVPSASGRTKTMHNCKYYVCFAVGRHYIWHNVWSMYTWYLSFYYITAFLDNWLGTQLTGDPVDWGDQLTGATAD